MSLRFLLKTAVTANLLALVLVTTSASAATSSWYFTDTGTTVPPASISTAVSGAPTASGIMVTSYADTLLRAPGLAPDLTSYFLNGTYITPAMAFAPAFTTSLSAYSARNIAPSTFVPRNSASAITFTNLPVSGSTSPVNDVLLVDFAYVNPAADNSFVIRDDVFSPSGLVVSSSTVSRDLHTGEYAPFHLPLYFGATALEDGMYGVRVRVYDSTQKTALDENSFNVRFQK